MHVLVKLNYERYKIKISYIRFTTNNDADIVCDVLFSGFNVQISQYIILNHLTH